MQIDQLLQDIYQSPTPFHACETMVAKLDAAGFTALDEADTWQLTPGGRYYLLRNQSSLIAFVYGSKGLAENGIRMLGAHTDSPCLKVKPNADIYHKGYWQLGVEVYGGVLLNPWFDRDLALAGRVHVKCKGGEVKPLLLNINQPLGMVASLAIHLDREANSQRSINAQKYLPVIMGVSEKDQLVFKTWLLAQLQKAYPSEAIDHVLDYEMSFYDYQQGSVYGVQRDFIASARLDNLLSCFVGLEALLKSNTEHSQLLICTDHEEVGSCSSSGAAGPMLEQFLQRLMPDVEGYNRMVSQSMMVSVDNAHGIHPNFAEVHDNNHGPLLGAGPVIKVNANQRYASNSETQAVFRDVCEQAGLPLQSFVVRSDMACGSTIGPITAGNLGVRTLDIGVPTFAMHSIRETAAVADCVSLQQSLAAFLSRDKL